MRSEPPRPTSGSSGTRRPLRRDRSVRARALRTLTRARSARRPIRASSTTSCCRHWPVSGASLSKFAADVRILSSPGFGEVAEPFGQGASRQLRDAVQAKPDSLRTNRTRSRGCFPATPTSRGKMPRRTFSSARSTTAQIAASILPEALLCADEIVTLARTVIDGLRVDERRIAQNLRTYAPFAGTQAVMIEAVRAGGDRQRLHEALRGASMEAWAAVRRGEGQPACASSRRG